MIHDFDVWSSGRLETNSLSDLSGAVLAIEASFYLDRLLNQPPSKEPLLPALGGLPFSLKAHIQNELGILAEHGVRPVFIFNGMEAGKKHRPFKDMDDAARLNGSAWELYNRHEAEQAVESFGKSGQSQYCIHTSPYAESIAHSLRRLFETRVILPAASEGSARIWCGLPGRTGERVGPGRSSLAIHAHAVADCTVAGLPREKLSELRRCDRSIH